ncbi:MAG TPA: CotH kinase family protein [Polyangiaceae bacterium]|nr:CotH kinase family protein [Polyangiaceae bacterium]
MAALGLLACSASPSGSPVSPQPPVVAGPSPCSGGSGTAGSCSQQPQPPGQQPPPSSGTSGQTLGGSGDTPHTPDVPDVTVDGGMPSPEPMSMGPGTVMADPMDEAVHIYDPAVVHTFDLEIAPADLEMVDSNPSAEQYVPARLTFEGVSYDVGYRYKGSIGAFFPPCTSLFGQKDGKCSVKLSFNWKDPKGQFFGLKKLLFHSMNSDPSMLRERLGYALFREMGVPAARVTHAILRVNGMAHVYALVEEIDGRFTRSRFTEGGKGNLYKEIWPIHDDPQAYIAALETNEDQDPSADRILRFKDAIRQSPEAMEAWMDLDVTASYMAVDRVIMNDDGAFHFYCFAGAIGNNPKPPGNHNYYWYEAKHADRLWIIPWDLDLSMSEALNPPHLESDWRTMPSADQCTGCEGASAGLAPATLCDRVFLNLHARKALYEAKVDAFIAGPFSKAAVDAKLDQWAQQLLSAGYPAEPSAVSELKAILDRARMSRGFGY